MSKGGKKHERTGARTFQARYYRLLRHFRRYSNADHSENAAAADIQNRNRRIIDSRLTIQQSRASQTPKRGDIRRSYMCLGQRLENNNRKRKGSFISSTRPTTNLRRYNGGPFGGIATKFSPQKRKNTPRRSENRRMQHQRKQLRSRNGFKSEFRGKISSAISLRHCD